MNLENMYKTNWTKYGYGKLSVQLIQSIFQKVRTSSTIYFYIYREDINASKNHPLEKLENM